MLSMRACVPVQFIKDKYWEYEFEEVVTPNIFNFDLWKTSGHADHYKEHMFCIDVEKQEYGLKPMNCPGDITASRACLPACDAVRLALDTPAA